MELYQEQVTKWHQQNGTILYSIKMRLLNEVSQSGRTLTGLIVLMIQMDSLLISSNSFPSDFQKTIFHQYAVTL